MNMHSQVRNNIKNVDFSIWDSNKYSAILYIVEHYGEFINETVCKNEITRDLKNIFHYTLQI